MYIDCCRQQQQQQYALGISCLLYIYSVKNNGNNDLLLPGCDCCFFLQKICLLDNVSISDVSFIDKQEIYIFIYLLINMNIVSFSTSFETKQYKIQ